MSNPHLHGPGHGPGHSGSEHEHGDRPGGPWAYRLELIITVALGLAAIVGAFAAYRNEQRNHEATAQFSLGVKNFDDAGQYYSASNATTQRYESQFLEYTKAIQANNAKLASYIYGNLMDSDLQKAVKWWESAANTSRANPDRTPFESDNPQFTSSQLAGQVLAARNTTNSSKGNFSEARKQQDEADHFTLVEVILATALFLYGIAGVSRNLTLKIGTLLTGALIFLISIVLLITG